MYYIIHVSPCASANLVPGTYMTEVLQQVEISTRMDAEYYAGCRWVEINSFV